MLEQRGPICAPKQPPGCCLVLSVSCREKKEQHRGHEEGTTGDVARLARQEGLDWGTSISTSLIDGGKDHKIDGGKDHKNLSNLSNLSIYQTDVGKTAPERSEMSTSRALPRHIRTRWRGFLSSTPGLLLTDLTEKFCWNKNNFGYDWLWYPERSLENLIH